MHRLDSRVKFLWYLTMLLLAFAWSDPLFLSVLVLSVLLFGIVAKERISHTFRIMLAPLPGYVMVLLFNLFLFDFAVKPMLDWDLQYLGWVIPQIGGYGPYGHVSVESLTFMLGVCMRLAVAVSVTRLFLTFTSPSDVTTALDKLHIPAEISAAISIAFGYLPEMARQVVSILEAQRSRGWHTKSRNPFKLIRMWVPVIMPIISRSISRSELLASAIISRGFGTNPGRRTSIKEVKFSRRDWASLFLLGAALSVGITIGIWVLGIAHFRVTVFILRSFFST